MPRQFELRMFLSAMRARLRPSDVGLPETTRRRVPGLRREEVAELVGVSPNWYAAFEMGAGDRHFSPAFVQRVADALQLNEEERVQLLCLALPEVATAAEHFERILTSADELVRNARASAGRALANGICQRLLAEESLLRARAAGGRALAAAICRGLADRWWPR